MAREITQHDLSTQSDEILHALDRGETFIVTRDGAAVGQLVPVHKRHFVDTEALQAAFAGLPAIDYQQFRADVDAILDQDPTPRV